MKNLIKLFYASLVTCISIAAVAEDIDLFASGLTEGAASDSLPNVIFLLDNTSNWSAKSQGWPDGDNQGESEVLAIKNTLAALPSDVDLNIGLVSYGTAGSSGPTDGAYVRWDLQPYRANQAAFEAVLDTIAAGITGTGNGGESRNSSNTYGYLISDVYNYLAGVDVNFGGAATPSMVDDDAYTTQYSVFRSPLTEGDVCSETYVIFITNPNAQGPARDDAANSAQLEALYSALGEAPRVALSDGSQNQSGGHIMPAYGELSDSGGGTGNTGGQGLIGQTEQCYVDVDACNDDVIGNTSESQDIQDACPAGSGKDKNPGNCACDATTETTSNVSGSACGTVSVKIKGKNTEIQTYSYDVLGTVTDVGGDTGWGVVDGSVDSAKWNLDDWTQFLHEFGVPLTIAGADGEDDFSVRVPVTTYTLDVFNAKPNDEHSSLMDSAAELGGGYRQSATNASELETALNRIFGDIIDVNTSFAAVTLPLSATNRAQAENKVFVGMFRPGAERKPRWLGNLKHYQLAVFNGQIELADVELNRAINPQTGFAQSCATTFWTEDTTDIDDATAGNQSYFDGLGLDPNPVSECQSEFLRGRGVLSDSPDGPFVEKGGAAQMIRNQVNDSNQSTRSLLTEASGSLQAVASSNFAETVYYDFLVGTNPGLKGGDLLIDDGSGTYVANPDLSDAEVAPDEGLRPTIHGDIVHSRPLTISYGPKVDGTTEFRIFYGANDGLYRAIDPNDGTEDWAFIAPEHYAGIERLYRNTPTIEYFGTDASLSTSINAERKQYFFDGSAGAYTEYNADKKLTKGYIYPTMRRGGRMVYGFDISGSTAGVPPSQPTLLWKLGCPNLTNDTDCTSGMSGIGQTWSTPSVGLVEGYGGGDDPVLFMGGGFDTCLDNDAATFPGTCSKGSQVYAIDAVSGTVLATFATDEPVVAEVTPVDLDSDGFVDFVYAADAAGNLYRVSLASLASEADSSPAPLTQGNWFMDKIADVSSSDVRFMNKPIVGELGSYVFVTLGTGDRERPLKVNYPYDSDVTNRFYVFIDRPFPYDEDGSGVLETDELEITPRPSVNLDGGTMVNASVGLADGDALIDKDGWYLELQDRGEQVVNQSAIGGGYVFFNTFQPEGGSQGLCSNLGTSKAYRIPLFAPENDDGEEFGTGVPIPPIIVTVDLDSSPLSCIGDNCGDGTIPDQVVTVCIGCEGFDPVEITPVEDNTLREAFRAENMDVQ